MIPFLISTTQFQIIVNTLYNIFEDTTSCSLLFLCQASRIDKRVLLNIRGNVLVVLIFADNKTRGNHWYVKSV